MPLIHCQAQIISTVAGTGTQGYSGDGVPATTAKINVTEHIILDASGNIYIADSGNNRIRKVNSTNGIITTIVGTATQGYSGDGGLATAANLNRPNGLAIDAAGNLYIADQDNHVIRKVSSAGIISTVAGTGTQGYSGDGGRATAAQLKSPQWVALDRSGNLYITDTGNNVIRKVSTNGLITTVAGTGNRDYIGDGGPATAANIDHPAGIAIDRLGNLYIADPGNSRIRKVSLNGTITTVAGNGLSAYDANSLNNPLGIALDTLGNLYIADAGNYCIRKVSLNGTITTVAGTGSECNYHTGCYIGDGGLATLAQLNAPSGVAIDRLGNIYIADLFNYRIRKVTFALTTTAPVATTNTNQTAMVGTPFSYTVNAFTDAETPNYLTYTARINPTNGLSFNAKTRVISGTLLTSGVSSVTVTATDPGSLSASTTFSITSTTACLGTLSPDYAVLAQLFEATGGANWTRKSKWLNGCSPCSWAGVTCNSSGQVTAINLSGNQLSGSIPASLSALTNLTGLYLYDNQLSGSIPASLSALTNLQSLYLANNQLSGTIPASLSALTNLTGLDLSNNQLSGSIPAGLDALTKLQFLLLNKNQLTGCWPASLSALCGGGRVIDFSTNAGLPGGGDFAQFCANGTGRCAAANTAPIATTNINQTAGVGSPFSYTVNAFTDTETPSSLTYSAVISPANGLSFNSSTRIISGAPTTTGGSIITITAVDAGGLSATTSFTLVVKGVDLAPTLSLPMANFTASGSNATRNFTMLVEETNGISTAGRVVITLTAPLGYSLTFDNSLTSITVSGTTNPVSVTNQDWSVSATSSSQMTLKLNQGKQVSANSRSAIGFSLTRTGASVGTANITVNINDDASHSYDSNPANNVYARNINALQ
ncbi:NHL domain-containing protein [Spirosoma lituiforme]